VQTVQAAGSGLKIGDAKLIELKLEYDNAPKFPRHGGDGFAPYTRDIQKGRIFLEAAAPDNVSPGATVISEASELVACDGSINRELGIGRLDLSDDTDYRHHSTRCLRLSSERKIHSATVKEELDEIIVSAEGISKIVPYGSKSTIELEKENVDVRMSDGQIRNVSVVPRIHIRNHGEMTFYGGENIRVYSRNSSDQYAQYRVRSAMVRNDIKKRGDGDIVVVPKFYSKQ